MRRVHAGVFIKKGWDSDYEQGVLSLPYTSSGPYVSSSHIISHYKFSNISTPMSKPKGHRCLWAFRLRYGSVHKCDSTVTVDSKFFSLPVLSLLDDILEEVATLEAALISRLNRGRSSGWSGKPTWGWVSSICAVVVGMMLRDISMCGRLARIEFVHIWITSLLPALSFSNSYIGPGELEGIIKWS